MMKRTWPVLLLIALVLGLAACGGDDDEGATAPPPTTAGETGGGGGGAGGTVEIKTSEGIEYDETSLETSAGEVTIDYTNDSGLPHNVILEGGGVDGEGTDTIQSGSASVKVNLDPGEYTFYCSVDGHRDAGMEGTLVVN
jgi:plastocyanin